MAVRYVNALDVYLLPTPTQQDPTSVSGAVQTLLGAWVDADVANPNQGWVRCKDRKGRSGFDLDLGTIHHGSQISTDLDDLDDAQTLYDSGNLATNFRKFIKAGLDAHQAGRLGRMERLYRRNLATDPPTLPEFGEPDLRLEVLAPVPANATGPIRLPVFSNPHKSPGNQSESHTINGNSIVLLLTYGNRRFLFGGDLNQPAQKYRQDCYANEAAAKRPWGLFPSWSAGRRLVPKEPPCTGSPTAVRETIRLLAAAE
jgi:hypothetical protein